MSVQRLSDAQVRALRDMTMGEMPFGSSEMRTVNVLVRRGLAVQTKPPGQMLAVGNLTVTCFTITDAGRTALAESEAR